MKVLVVEDYADRRSSVGSSLQRRDYRVEQVCDMSEAVVRAAHEDFDLIILDLAPASESSLLVLHEIRELNRDSEILILSTPGQINDRVTALIQGADDYLVKPFTAEDLYARISSLEKRRAHTRAAADSRDSGNARQPNRLLENLMQIRQGENRGIELVIGEVGLAQLIARVIACLYDTATHKRVVLRPPRRGLPAILVDARWMEHMLLNLLNHALSQSPPGAEITLDFHAEGEVGELVIDSRLASTPQGRGYDELFGGLHRRPGDSASETLDSLSLAKFCADCLGLGLQGCIEDDDHMQLRVCNIRII